MFGVHKDIYFQIPKETLAVISFQFKDEKEASANVPQSVTRQESSSTTTTNESQESSTSTTTTAPTTIITTNSIQGNTNAFERSTCVGRIMSRFYCLQKLKNKPEGLFSYVSIMKNSKGKIYVISEYEGVNVLEFIKYNQVSIKDVEKWLAEIIDMVHFLHSQGIEIRTLTHENVFINRKGKVRMGNWGLFFITGQGQDVNFSVRHPRGLAPELLDSDLTCSMKADVWDIGILARDLIQFLTHKSLDSGQGSSTVEDPVDRIYNKEPLKFMKDIKEKSFLTDIAEISLIEYEAQRVPVETLYRFSLPFLDPPPVDSNGGWRKYPVLVSDFSDAKDVSFYSPELLFFLWKLTSKENIEKCMTRSKVYPPSIFKLPAFIPVDEPLQAIQLQKDNSTQEKFDSTLLPLNLNSVYQIMQSKSTVQALKFDVSSLDWKMNHDFCEESGGLPIITNGSGLLNQLQELNLRWITKEKEKDATYQYAKFLRWHRMLREFPLKSDMFTKGVKKDIHPFWRGKIWAAMLDVRGDPDLYFYSLDMDTPHPMERQLELDIPRCHQYNETLASPLGRWTLKRVMKACILSERDKFVYWQGFDSVCAPFVLLNLHDEATAYECVLSFVKRFLAPFYVENNSFVIREYMTCLKHLITFHDPELSNHLNEIGLSPDLFAIPWFMTMFAHFFSLDKIMVIWDCFLAGSPHLPMCFAFALLQCIRDQLMNQDFNQSMLLFSDIGSANVEKALMIAHLCCRYSPPSLCEGIQMIEITPISPLKSVHEPCGRISVADFLKIKNKSLILDIRSSDSFESGHLKQCHYVNEGKAVGKTMFQLSLLIQRYEFCILIVDDKSDIEEAVMQLLKNKVARILLLDMCSLTLAEVNSNLCTCDPKQISSSGLMKCTC